MPSNSTFPRKSSRRLSFEWSVKTLFFSFSMQSIQNLGLAVISQAAGTIVDKKGYLVLEVFFCAWLCGKIILVVIIMSFCVRF